MLTDFCLKLSRLAFLFGIGASVLMWFLALADSNPDIDMFYLTRASFRLCSILCAMSILSMTAEWECELRDVFITVGLLALSLVALLFVKIYSPDANNRSSFADSQINYNIRIVGKTLQHYSKDHQGYLPAAADWCGDLIEYYPALKKDDFKMTGYTEDCLIAYNSNIAGRKLDQVNDDVALIFSARGNWNLSGASELIESNPPERFFLPVFTAGGSLEQYRFNDKLEQLIRNDSVSDIPFGE